MKNFDAGKKELKTINVIGLGYIGLPTACYLAKAGFRVKILGKPKEEM
ncbi:MAG: hypothetical protein WC288_00895 [Candidatus Paceibacterota bacterium]|jgi:UDP-N-acetyl-D-mannosaminuronate dehydrogenase